jgi:hypothetical protein
MRQRQEDLKFKVSPGQDSSKTLSQNKIRTGDIAQVVACLPSKHEALSSIPSNSKNYIWWWDFEEVTGII